MKKNVVSLCEGITLHHIPVDKFTSNHFSVHFVTPLAKKTVSLYSLLSKIFTNGCTTYPDKESFSKKTADLYAAIFSASVTKIGEEESLSLSINALDECLAYDGMHLNEEAFSLLREVILHPVTENGIFPLDVVEREKKVLIDEIEAAINNKNTYAIKRCREVMCEGELYSLAVEGDTAQVRSATASALYQAYETLLHTARIEIIYIGRETLDVVRARATSLAGALGARQYSSAKPYRKSAAEDVRLVTESVSAIQGKLAMGFRLAEDIDTRTLDALRLFNLIYGASPIAKLFMNVRERLSLCYYCASRMDPHKGIMFVYSGVENEKMPVAEEEIVRQLEEIRQGRVTEEELLCAQKAMRDVSRSITDSSLGIERWVLDKTVTGENRMPDEVSAAIDELTVEDVAKVASLIRLDTIFRLTGTEGGASDAV